MIGANIQSKFFPHENPVNKYLKFGYVWLKVIGVLQRATVNVEVSGFANTGVNVMNDNIYIPVKTFLLRYENRALVNSKFAQTASTEIRLGGEGTVA